MLKYDHPIDGPGWKKWMYRLHQHHVVMDKKFENCTYCQNDYVVTDG